MFRRCLPRLLTRERHLQTLGLDTTIGTHSQDDIKAAYRKQAKKFHPDVPNTGDLGRFKSIQEAYNVLSGNDYDPGYGWTQTRSNPREEPTKSEGTGANWARGGTYYKKGGLNNDDEFANRSTANFYRPYSSQGSRFTGFTPDEVSSYKNRVNFFRFFRFLKQMAIFGLVYLCYKYYCLTAARHQLGIDMEKNLYTDDYFKRVAEDKAAGVLPTQTGPASYTYRPKAHEEEQQRSGQGRTVKLEGNKQIMESKQPVTVSYKGQPFTPEGLANLQQARMRKRKGLPEPVVEAQDDDVCCEMDD